jgi:type I restriction enzyme, S subunit
LIQDSDVLRNQLAVFSNATTIEVVYSATMASLNVPIPPVEEQSKILRFISCESARMEDLVTGCQHAVAILQERRTALISAAVTRKIDVRGIADAAAAEAA